MARLDTTKEAERELVIVEELCKALRELGRIAEEEYDRIGKTMNGEDKK